MAKRKDIKIEYDGKSPNLCGGTLIVYIGEKKYDFGDHCLISGGMICRNDDWEMWAEEGPWGISEWPEGFPDDDGLKILIVDVINEEIPHGCCGGCI